MELLNWELLARFLGVLGTNLILSGDNAVVIAMAARQLRGSRRRKAIIWGAAGAVGLRLVFAAIVTLLLEIPLLQAVGGILLFWIAWKLVHDDTEEYEDKVRAGESVWDAVKIIIIADAVMSLDNVVALVGLSEGNLWLLGIGLILTIPLVIWGSTLLSALLDRFSWLVYGGAALLAWVGLRMIFQDYTIYQLVAELLGGFEVIVRLIGTVAFVGIAWWWARRKKANQKQSA